ncbi:MAG: dockerin type I repeat-containing protein [Clostridia bacterium]|nr:dockerin type I repeat-containing protein [Clostridia bacterium]
MKKNTTEKRTGMLWRVLFAAALTALLFAVCAVTALAATDIKAGDKWLYSLDRLYENTVYAPMNAPKPYLKDGQIEITAVNLYVYNANGTYASYASGAYTPTLKDNVYGVKVAVVGRPADGYQWPDGDPSQIRLIWDGANYVGGGNVIAVGEKRGNTQYAIFLFDAWVRGNVDTIDLSVPVPTAGSVPDNTLTFNAADDHGYSVQYVRWKVNNGSWGDGPAVWQGGDKIMVSVRLTRHGGCTFKDDLKVRLNGTQLAAGTEGDAYYYKASNYIILYYTFNLEDSLSAELDLTSGPVTVTNPDYQFGLAERYLNMLLTLANKPVPATYVEATYDLDLNNDGKTDLTLAYKPRIPSGSNIRKSSIVITPEIGLWRAMGKTAQKTFTLTMDQQAALAGNSRVFWQKLNLTVSPPRVTIDPNGGKLRSGYTSPVTIVTDSAGKLTSDMLSAYCKDDETDFGMYRFQHFAMGFAKNASATSPTATRVSSLCGTYDEDTTWYVMWKKQAYGTIDPNGGAFANGSKNVASFPLNRDNKISSGAPYFDDSASNFGLQPPANHVFKGFCTKKDGTGSYYYKYKLIDFGDEGSTWYIIWDKLITVTVDPNGGYFTDGTNTPRSVTIKSGERLTYSKAYTLGIASSYHYYREGHVFMGVSYTKDGAVAYNINVMSDLYSSDGPVFTEDTTLYFSWAEAATLYYDLNGGQFLGDLGVYHSVSQDIYDAPPPRTVPYGEKINVQYYDSTRFVRDGYIPSYWATDRAGEHKLCGVDEYGELIVTAKETTVYLIWEESPTLVIRVQPTRVYGDENNWPLRFGGEAIFFCSAAGKGVTYQWQVADSGLMPIWRDMPGETANTLTVTAEAADWFGGGRVYRCVVRDENGAQLESDATYCKPSYCFFEGPWNYSGKAGETAVFKIDVSASEPTYTWKAVDASDNEVNIEAIAGVTGVHSPELKVPIAAALDGYGFYCVVTDLSLGGSQIISDKGRLNVYGNTINEIAITISPEPAYGAVVGDVKITMPTGIKEPSGMGGKVWYLITDPEAAAWGRDKGGLSMLRHWGEAFGGCYVDIPDERTFTEGVYLLGLAVNTVPDLAMNVETLRITLNGRLLEKEKDYHCEGGAYLYLVYNVVKPHDHVLVKTDEVPATCGADGTKAYYTCSICGKKFSDAAGKHEIAVPETIPATGKHTWDKGEITVKPTATDAGVKTFTCLVCGATKTEPVPPGTGEDELLLGDVDNDGKVTASDARLALRGAVGLESYAPDSRSFKAADVNLDNQLTAADARLILRKAVGFTDKEFGVKY